jgi:alcohol dehydrogenase class IV
MIPEMARLAFEANYNRWNPRHTTHENFVALFEKAYEELDERLTPAENIW